VVVKKTVKPVDKIQDDSIDQIVVNREYFKLWISKLEEHLDERWESQNVLLNERWDAQNKALMVALASMDKRLDSMNEFREALKDREAVTLSRTEFDLAMKPISSDLRELRDWKNMVAGMANAEDLARVNVIAVVGIIGGLLGIVLSVIALFGI